jgi:hypothetical protein
LPVKTMKSEWEELIAVNQTCRFGRGERIRTFACWNQNPVP